MEWLAIITQNTTHTIQRPHTIVSHTEPGGHSMLASTIQISNNNPTNPHPTHKRVKQAKESQPEKTNPHQPDPKAQPMEYLIPQDPTVCLDPSSSHHTPQVPHQQPQKSYQ